MVVEQMKPDTHPTRQMSSGSFLPHEKIADQARWVWLKRFQFFKLNLVYRSSKQHKRLYIKVGASLVGLAKG